MSDAAVRTPLPEPAPGFVGLVGIHLRLLVREARLGAAIVALLCVLLPVAAVVSAVGWDATGIQEDAPGRVELYTIMMMVLTVFMAFLWPEAVWRKLGPGDRMVLDAFPVPRRSHRMARVVAGASLPLALLGSVLLTVAILDARGWTQGVLSLGLDQLPGVHGVGILATLASVLAAYALSSVLALRFGKVFVGLLIVTSVIYLIPLILVIFGFSDLVTRLGDWATASPFSPIPVLTGWFQGGGEDLLPGLAWLAVFGGLAGYFAGRHGGT